MYNLNISIMSGYGVLDFMVRTYRNNRNLLKKRKSLKTIYQENNLHYIKKKIEKKTETFDAEATSRFLEKIQARQKKARRKRALLLVISILTVALILLILSQAQT